MIGCATCVTNSKMGKALIQALIMHLELLAKLIAREQRSCIDQIIMKIYCEETGKVAICSYIE